MKHFRTAAAFLAASMLLSACGNENTSGSNSFTNAGDMQRNEAEDRVSNTLEDVYYLLRYESSWNNSYHLSSYFVEFFDDGTVSWWSDPEYGKKYYYSGTYEYNENRDIYSLSVESLPTYTLTKDGDSLIFQGDKFNDEIFKKSEFDNIHDAVEGRHDLYDRLYESDQIGYVNSNGQKINF